LELIFVELKKFKKELPEIHTTLERWITFLNKAHEYSKEDLPREIATEEIRKAMEQLEFMYFDDIEQEHYESQQRRYLDELSIERQEERKIQKAIDNAKAETKMETEIETKLNIAKKMKSKGKPTNEIVEFTGLSHHQIEEL